MQSVTASNHDVYCPCGACMYRIRHDIALTAVQQGLKKELKAMKSDTAGQFAKATDKANQSTTKTKEEITTV